MRAAPEPRRSGPGAHDGRLRPHPGRARRPGLFPACTIRRSAPAARRPRRAGHSAAELQLSGLAAKDARDRQIMMAGFVLLGRVTALRPARPWLVLVAGAASIAAGLFRRDHLLLDCPGFAGESWHNQVHDVVSGVAYGAMLAAPLVLARRWRDDPGWTPVSRPVQALALVSAGVLAVFASRIAGPCNGIVQRVRG